MGGPTADELFAAMTSAVAKDPSLKSRFNASVVFALDKDDASNSFRLDATKGEPKLKPELTVLSTLAVFHDLLGKKMTPQQAFMKGKLKIKGKMALAMKLQLILNATRKRLRTTDPARSRL